MSDQARSAVLKTLLTHLTPDFCRSIEDGLMAAGVRAHLETAQRDEGHRANHLGQARHFHSNEQFVLALDLAGIPHNPLRGNDIIIGNVGPLLLGRFSTSNKRWNNASRSKRRLDLASHNQWVERMVQPDFLSEAINPSAAKMTVFFVSVFSGSIRVQPEQPISIEIAVLDTTLSTRLFSESISNFMAHFAEPAQQADKAQPRLKVVSKEKDGGA